MLQDLLAHGRCVTGAPASVQTGSSVHMGLEPCSCMMQEEVSWCPQALSPEAQLLTRDMVMLHRYTGTRGLL